MNELQQKLLETFQGELTERIEGIRQAMAQAIASQGAQEAAFDDAYRHAHSLKGAASAVDLTDVEQVCVQLETLFYRLRSRSMALDESVADVVNRAVGALLARGSGEPGSEEAVNSALRQLEGLLEGDEAAAPVLPSPLSELHAQILEAFQGESKEHLEAIRGLLAQTASGGAILDAEALDEAFRRAHNLKGGARLSELSAVEALAHRIESAFSLVRDGQLALTREVATAVNSVLDAIEDLLDSVEKKQLMAVPSEALAALDKILSHSVAASDEETAPAGVEPTPPSPLAASGTPSPLDLLTQFEYRDPTEPEASPPAARPAAAMTAPPEPSGGLPIPELPISDPAPPEMDPPMPPTEATEPLSASAMSAEPTAETVPESLAEEPAAEAPAEPEAATTPPVAMDAAESPSASPDLTAGEPPLPPEVDPIPAAAAGELEPAEKSPPADAAVEGPTEPPSDARFVAPPAPSESLPIPELPITEEHTPARSVVGAQPPPMPPPTPLRPSVLAALEPKRGAASPPWLSALVATPSPKTATKPHPAIRLVGMSQAAAGSASKTVPARPTEMVKVSLEHLDPLYRAVVALLAESQKQEAVQTELASLSGTLSEMLEDWDEIRCDCASNLRKLSVDPALTPITHYIELVGKQLKAFSRDLRSARRTQREGTWTLKTMSQRLRRDVRRIYTVPVHLIYSSFRKMMRDLARQEGKEIEFDVQGFDIEADRTVLQTLKDPLMHLLRNSIFHGIEAPAERAAAGKPAAGKVSLRFAAEGNRLEVTVTDDGRGFDVAKIVKAAVQQKVVSSSEAAGLSPDQARSLLFRPGFSTAGRVTEIGGRGMGLSVVDQEIKRLGGEAVAEENPGGGARFVLRVPLLVSTRRLVMARCSGQTFAIPTAGIVRLVRVNRSELQNVGGKTTMAFENETLRVVSLSEVLGLGEVTQDDERRYLPAVVLRDGLRRLIVTVDSFVGDREGVIKELGKAADGLDYVAGGIILETGMVSLVIEPKGVIDSVDADRKIVATSLDRDADPNEDDGTIRPFRVLVVDDSITTRTLEKSILEAYGYQVELAVDGEDAMNRLRLESFDLIITDLEMPRMNGFELVAAVKSDARLKSIPMIMVTSKDEPENKARGLKLGADAYVVKQKFDQQELLDTIRQFL